MKNNDIRFGIDNLLNSSSHMLYNMRLGVLVNQASLTHSYEYTYKAINGLYGKSVIALFSPQHGLWGEQQANMIETPHTVDKEDPKLPIYSLYSEVRSPTQEMLEKIDCLVIDLQDVGTRVYTFIWTVINCVKVCAEMNIKVILLDRPNPLGDLAVEGPCLNLAYASFVGMWSIPMRHGLTYGEMTRLLIKEMNIDVDFDIVPVTGWKRKMLFAELDRHWIAPSPNLPTFFSVLVYPGQVLLEGTNLSEGRGTTIPFEVCGAPYIKGQALVDFLKNFDLKGVIFLPIRFRPTFDKWKHQSCEGIRIIVTDQEKFNAYKTTVAILRGVAHLWPEYFQFTPPPYEYETIKMPIDILSGDSILREKIMDNHLSHQDFLETLTTVDMSNWNDRTEDIKLYIAD